jgi:hypothetical protein
MIALAVVKGTVQLLKAVDHAIIVLLRALVNAHEAAKIRVEAHALAIV